MRLKALRMVFFLKPLFYKGFRKAFSYRFYALSPFISERVMRVFDNIRDSF